MRRESDLNDVWFDSGAMPYAQIHYPFEHADSFDKVFPADFIAEGVDQTRGWFFTLHAISVDAVRFGGIPQHHIERSGARQERQQDVEATGQRRRSLRRAFSTYGADATRWYMISNSQPWDNLKFDREGVDEVRRKFFGTLYNTYSFFALYANVDGFTGKEAEIPVAERPEIDRWIISLLNTLVKDVTRAGSTTTTRRPRHAP